MRLLLALTAGVALATAQTPRFLNAQLQTLAANGNLSAQWQQAKSAAGPLWLGYSVPRVASNHNDGGCGVSYLETGDRDSGGEHVAALESPRQLYVLYRLSHGDVDKIRTFSEYCELDAGGLPVRWLTGVSTEQSVALLESLVPQTPVQNGGIAAIALTDGAAADAALDRMLGPGQAETLRKRVVFWLGAARGHAGFMELQKVARGDASIAVRTQTAFGLNVSADPGAVEELIRMAKTDAAPKVREQALFWLSQKAGKKAAATLGSAVSDDPDTAVKERAVFGLSQLPNHDGVPMLIQVAETNPNPAVRKKAIFWLGQSHDPRALDFFQKILQ